MVDIEKICRDAADTAAELGVTLGYAPEDVEKLEDIILPKCRAWYQDGTITEEKGVWNFAVLFGIYLGEIMLRNYAQDCGYHWGLRDGNLPVLVKNDGTEMSPISKTEKRILNGPEDSVASFYQVGRLFAEGRLDAAKSSLKPHQ